MTHPHKPKLCPLCRKPPTHHPGTSIPSWQGMSRFAKYAACEPKVIACRTCYNKEAYIIKAARIRGIGPRALGVPCANPECRTTEGSRHRPNERPYRFDSEEFAGKVCLACHEMELTSDPEDDPIAAEAIHAEAKAIRDEEKPPRPPRRYVRWEQLPSRVMVRCFHRDPSRLIEPGIYLREARV